jgi:hypothetical protein
MKRTFILIISLFVIAIGIITLFAVGRPAYANGDAHTHFRYGHITWIPSGGTTVEFTLQNAWRRNAYSTANGRCTDPTTMGSIPCSGVDGFAGIGDIIAEFQGFTLFSPDGVTQIGSPRGPLLYLVTSIDPANNWLFGLALDPTSLPAVDTSISFDYGVPGNYLAFTDSCCRISPLVLGNAHINNPDGGYRVETLVNVNIGNSSPISVLPPIVSCPINTLCSFQIPAADPNGDQLNFRLSIPVEASSSPPFGYTACVLNFCQPGATGSGAPNLASISSTGLYTWDTTGATLGPSGTNTLYSTQVTIEDLDPDGNMKSKVALDFLIQLVEEDINPPVIEPPAGEPPICETTQVISVGQTKTFDVIGSDPDPDDLVTLNVVGLPVGATMSPSLPIVGNPVSSSFNWTPNLGQVGLHVASFSASSTGGGFDLCSVILEVVEQIEVDIDIKPSSDPNSINCNDNTEVISVAILTTDEFDAMTVDHSTVTFENASEIHINKKSGETRRHDEEDVDLDGDIDLVFHFYLGDTSLTCSATDGTLSGETFDGQAITGTDAIRMVDTRSP